MKYVFVRIFGKSLRLVKYIFIYLLASFVLIFLWGVFLPIPNLREAILISADIFFDISVDTNEISDGFIISEDSSYSRYGSEVVIDLKKYGIDLIANGGNYYIPLQTVSDTLLALPCYVLLLYNEESVFVYKYGSEAGKDL